ncbi:MAG: thioredoxin, partial [Alphaproteobacteria bacterium]|nr:thioredoxin [Alphaproteobacteria bacterium]
MSLHQVTDSTFDKDVLQSDMPVIVDFWAEWCGPCRMLLPVLEEAAPEVAGRVKIMKVNVDQCPQVATRFNVRSIPTMIFF